MTVRVKRHQPAWLLIAIALAFAGCGGKDAVTPVDIEKQAWEDLRSEVRETISDPERAAEAIKLVDALAEDLNAFREVLTKRHERVRELNFLKAGQSGSPGWPAACIKDPPGVSRSHNAGGVVAAFESAIQSDERGC